MYPKVLIHVDKYQNNLKMLLDTFHSKGFSVMVVSKVFGADQRLIEGIDASSADFIADSRIQNLKSMTTTKPKVLLRLPQMSEIKAVIRYADISLNASLKTILKLNQEALRQNKVHKIILMIDIGDLREGIYYRDFDVSIINQILSLSNIKLAGIGTNLTCYGGVIPTYETMKRLDDIQRQIEQSFSLKLSLISGGNSSIYPFIESDEYPKNINNVRIGELLILGRETSYGTPVLGLYDDVITLQAQVVETANKPSVPEGLLGLNAFGEPVSFEDRGLLNRAILAIGKQDVHPDHLICPKGIHILGASSDHLIVEIQEEQTLDIGDVLEFKLTYGGILSLMTSKYVRKTYV